MGFLLGFSAGCLGVVACLEPDGDLVAHADGPRTAGEYGTLDARRR